MRYFSTIFVLFFAISGIFAQVPAGYYNSAVGKSGEELRTALFNIIKNHSAIEYGDLWTAYTSTDVNANGKVWDIYSDIPGGTAEYYFNFGSDKCGNYSQEGDCYNREHTIPQSWFNDAMPMKTDLFHLYPTDGFVNNKRGNWPYGKVSSPTWTSSNGSKLGPCDYPGCSGTVFEPIDAYKGDLARSYFYMTVRYKDKNLGQASESVFNGSQLKDWAKNMFVTWSNSDPVSDKEIHRNDVIYNSIQHNRNPFIDCPELVDYLFGSHVNEPWYPTCVDWSDVDIEEYGLTDYQACRIFPNPASDNVTIESNYINIGIIEVFDLSGRCVLSRSQVDSKRCDIHVADLRAGCYFVRVTTNRTTEMLKLIVK